MIKKGIICETLGSTDKLQLNESKNGEVRLSGVFGVCGVRNNNKRVYEKKNYGACVTEMQHRIVSEGVLGELEHPQSSNINLNNVSHKIESIEMNEDGTVTGTILLLNTAKGRDARAIVEGGVPLFISSRAAGTIDANGSVTLDHIQTYDLVGTPGFSEARLDVAESVVGDTVMLCESADGANNMYMIVESVIEEACDKKKQKKVTEDDKADDTADDDKADDTADDGKADDGKAGDGKAGDGKAGDGADDGKADDGKAGDVKDDATDGDTTTDIINNMDAIKSSIDKLTDKIAELEAQLHVTGESLEEQARVIEEQKETINELADARVNYDAIEAWVREEYGAEVDNKINEASGSALTIDDVKEYLHNDFADTLQKWITEEYSAELQKWITEEYGKDVDEKVNEAVSGMAASITEECNKNISDFLESRKANKFEKFDKMIEQLAESKDGNKEALKMLNEGREAYANVYAVKNMPVQYAPLWESLSTEKRAEIARASRMYNFTKAGVLESFWASQFNMDSVKNNMMSNAINESAPVKEAMPGKYAELFARAHKMAIR